MTGNSSTFSTVTVAVAVPLTVPLVAVIVLVPIARAVKKPVLELIVPTLVLLLFHITVAVITLPFWSLGVAVKVVVLATTTDVVAGETVIAFISGGVGFE
jgi:hypothetical protein